MIAQLVKKLVRFYGATKFHYPFGKIAMEPRPDFDHLRPYSMSTSRGLNNSKVEKNISYADGSERYKTNMNLVWLKALY
jgi:hypothetical protein